MITTVAKLLNEVYSLLLTAYVHAGYANASRSRINGILKQQLIICRAIAMMCNTHAMRSFEKKY